MNSKKAIISPSILSADFANLESEIKSVNNAEWLHIDVMDGHFVPNITIGVPVVKSLRKVTDKILDVHLMIDNPQKYVEDFVAAGADIITFHYEATKEFTQDVIDLIHSKNIKAGLSIKPNTNVEEIKNYIDKVEMILVMTVEPGFGGQKFIDGCAKKIEEIKKLNQNVQVEVDGGINQDTAKVCKNFGANILVAGSYIFKAENRNEAIKKISE